MPLLFSGHWTIVVAVNVGPRVDFTWPVRIVLGGDADVAGTYFEPAAGLSLSVHGTNWTLGVQLQDGDVPSPPPPLGWSDAALQVTSSPGVFVIEVNDKNLSPGGPFDHHFVLVCTSCEAVPTQPAAGSKQINPPADGTWVSWGVKVDGGGPTGRGPVPPWQPFVREIGVGLALADAALLVRGESKARVLEVAAKQLGDAAAHITKLMQSGQE